MTALPSFIQALLEPSRYPHPAKRVRLLETHISWVLLAGRYAYKIKKPVDFGFLNFSELRARKFYCEEEIRLNSRLAPQLYLDVLPIVGGEQQPQFGGEPAFEYAVKMRRFPVTKQLDHLLMRGKLIPQHIDDLAATFAKFHTDLPPAPPESNYGTAETLVMPVRHNFEHLAHLLPSSDLAILDELQTATEQLYSRCFDLFAQRHQQGFIRECHGDLHLGNIVLLNNAPVAFDGLEFEPKLRWIDVISDIAFLIMDLNYRGRDDLAFRFLNAYLQATGDYQGVGVLRFYLAYRAMVRAKVAAIRHSQTAEHAAMDDCRGYMRLAGRYLSPAKPILIITYGLPGCGKTTVSQVVLEQLQAIRLRSDVERKRLFGLAADADSGGTIYDAAATQRTYAHLLQLAGQLLNDGFSVVVDAAFLKHGERQAFRELAANKQLPFIILSVQTDFALLKQRIESRQQQGKDASEADLNIVEKLQAANEPLRADESACVVEWQNNQALDDSARQALIAKIIHLAQNA